MRLLLCLPALFAALLAHAEPSPALRELGVQQTAFTPYDRYLADVRAVFDRPSGGPASLTLACHLLEQARHFRYESRDPRRPDPPEFTEKRHAGDCKSKALWLYRGLNDRTALFVIGKAAAGAKISHAWVYWRHEERWWILDPTTRAEPVAVDTVSPKRYVPYYSWGKEGAYRHHSTRLLLPADPTPAIAAPRSGR